MFVLNFFSKQICNVEALICHFYKNIKTLTQIHFPRDPHIFRTCTIFYRHCKGLHQMQKDLVLCALDAHSRKKVKISGYFHQFYLKKKKKENKIQIKHFGSWKCAAKIERARGT